MEFYTSQSLKWPNPPQKILVIQKIHDPSVGPAFVELIKWLLVVNICGDFDDCEK